MNGPPLSPHTASYDNFNHSAKDNVLEIASVIHQLCCIAADSEVVTERSLKTGSMQRRGEVRIYKMSRFGSY